MYGVCLILDILNHKRPNNILQQAWAYTTDCEDSLSLRLLPAYAGMGGKAAIVFLDLTDWWALEPIDAPPENPASLVSLLALKRRVPQFLVLGTAEGSSPTVISM